MRVILKESGIWTPEDPGGPPPTILFGPNAILKIRTTLLGEIAMQESTGVLGILYQGRYSITEEVPSREWAMVGSFGGGQIPIQYRLPLPQMSDQEMVAANGSILDAGLRTQNCDKGFDKYVRKFNPEEESSAVVSIESGGREITDGLLHLSKDHDAACSSTRQTGSQMKRYSGQRLQLGPRFSRVYKTRFYSQASFSTQTV
jgi:hypothetical protein